LIASIELRPSGDDDDELLAAVRFIGQLVGDKRRWLPGFSPSAFIDNQWRAHVVDTARGRLDRRSYELCAAYELRSALRAGRVWVPASRRHADPASLLLPDEQWQEVRCEFARAVERPIDGNQRLARLAAEQPELDKPRDRVIARAIPFTDHTHPPTRSNHQLTSPTIIHGCAQSWRSMM
jgi:hypothetical protein